MNIFISWSGERSLHLAEGLRDWLRYVLPDAKPWMSSTDIERGTQWRSAVRGKLDETSIGIICLTPDNLVAPWLLFEAGALSKNEGRVFTYLYELDPSLVEEPLSQYQHTLATKEETLRLVLDINGLSTVPRDEEYITKTFDKFWDDLDASLKSVPSSDDSEEPVRTDSELIREMLGLVREIPKMNENLRSLEHDVLMMRSGAETSASSFPSFFSQGLSRNDPRFIGIIDAYARDFRSRTEHDAHRRNPPQTGPKAEDGQEPENDEQPNGPQQPSP